LELEAPNENEAKKWLEVLNKFKPPLPQHHRTFIKTLASGGRASSKLHQGLGLDIVW
jgi:hypothetical protein